MEQFTLKDLADLAKKVIEAKDIPLGYEFLDHRRNGEDGNRPYYKFFYHLTQWLKPEMVVELGGCRGTATAHFAGGNPKTTVITVDHHTDPGDEKNIVMMYEACVNLHNIRYVRGWTEGITAREQKGKHALGDGVNAYPIVCAYLDNKPIDILFVDSWHQYEYAMRDWTVYKGLMAKPSLVIFDDLIGGDGPAIGGMRRFWDEVEGEKMLIDGLNPGYPQGYLLVK